MLFIKLYLPKNEIFLHYAGMYNWYIIEVQFVIYSFSIERFEQPFW
jgi:hypothetical protein